MLNLVSELMLAVGVNSFIDPEMATVTICVAAFFGSVCVAMGERLKIPSIALLLVSGVLLGPALLGWVRPELLGPELETVIALAMAIILFEGGLTLDITGFKRAPRAIFFMLTIGVLITWIGAACGAYFLFGLNRDLSLVAGSLLIVTGPTVVSPILRRVGVRERIKQVLYWEGVLVDAIGVFIALLCFQWATLPEGDHAMGPVGMLALRFLVGVGVGFLVGLLVGYALKHEWIAREHVNVSVLATALLSFGVSNLLLHESGILSVIVAGLTINLQHPAQLKQLKRFKLDLTELGLGVVFILLAARLKLSQFAEYGWRLPALLVIVLFVLRPLNVFLSTLRQNFSLPEKLFLSWLAPRGIVAASMASLFTLRLIDKHPEAGLLETGTYAVIATTVLLQGLSAPFVARFLGLKKPEQGTLLVVGQPGLAVPLCTSLRQAGALTLVATDTDADLEFVQKHGIDAMDIDPLNPESAEDPRLGDVEALLCVDPAADAKVWAHWAELHGKLPCFLWLNESSSLAKIQGATGIWEGIPAEESLKSGLADGRLTIDVIESGGDDDARRFGPSFCPLAWVEKGHVRILTKPLDPGRPDGGTAVVLHRRIAHFKGLIEDGVIIDHPNPNFTQVVTALLNAAVQKHPHMPVDKLLEGILEREQTMSTSIGSGVAIPHTYDDSVQRSVCFVANVLHGLPNTAQSEEPSRLVFLLISPTGKAHEHLKGLAAIAELASDQSFLGYLADQNLRTRLLSILRERG